MLEKKRKKMLEESKHASGQHLVTDVSDAAKSETSGCMLILFILITGICSLFKKTVL